MDWQKLSTLTRYVYFQIDVLIIICMLSVQTYSWRFPSIKAHENCNKEQGLENAARKYLDQILSLYHALQKSISSVREKSKR